MPISKFYNFLLFSINPLLCINKTDNITPIGANGFVGLVGLIVQIEKGSFSNPLNKIEFLDMADKIEIPTLNIVLNQEEYQQFLKNQILNGGKRYCDN